jgi:hypothetical protein
VEVLIWSRIRHTRPRMQKPVVLVEGGGVGLGLDVGRSGGEVEAHDGCCEVKVGV